MLKIIFGGSHVDGRVGVASWLVCSTMDQVVQVRALAGDIVLCSWTRHLYSLMLGVALQWTRGEEKYYT